MDIGQIKELMGLLEESTLAKLVFKKGDLELHLEKAQAAPVHSSASRMVYAENASETAFQSEIPLQGERGAGRRVESQEASGIYVTSPMVGTFYTSAAPDQPSFVKPGDAVDAHTVVCIIEAMKVMNEVKAGVSGIVAEILTDNAQPVEFGSRLFRIK
ncbi:MAG: acetyl-CoA carboxylase biotin carboxyl carrier protein [Chlamydiia bacterium]|nr:acetyl-CoA carboxylase biotin carboxyl carrier protein [Chlamydiia bacterium]